MKNVSLSLVSLFVLASFMFFGCARTVEAPSNEEPAKALVETGEEGFVSLFNGENLAGWRRHDTVPESDVGGKWEIVNGVIEGDQDPPGSGGFLVTDQKFQDFLVEMEINLDFPTDSGVFLRMGEDGKSHQVTLDNVEGGEFGAIYLPWTQSGVHSSPKGKQYYKQGEWNHVRVQIESEPARIQFWLNDHLVTDFQHTAETSKGVPGEGYLGIQIHPGERWEEGTTRFASAIFESRNCDKG